MTPSPNPRILHPLPSTAAEVEHDAPSLCELLHSSSGNEGTLLLYTKSCSSFDQIRGIWNLRHQEKRPWAVARCLTTAAVQTVINFVAGQQAARGHEPDTTPPPFPLVIRSGGHDMDCRSAGPDSLVLDIRGLDSITLSPDRNSVTIGGGVSTGNLSRFLDEHNLTSTPGLCNTVGVVGFATGGGYSVISGTYGLGVDQILGGKLVTTSAAGEGSTLVDTDDDPELLWALRGAGNGNFGVIVELRLKVYERPAFLGGALLYPAAETEHVLNGLSKLLVEEGHPRNFGGESAIVHMPGLGAVLNLFFTWTEPLSDRPEPLAEGREWLRKCEALGTVLVNTVTETTPSSIANSLDAAVSTPLHVEFKTFTVAEYTPELASILSRNIPPAPLGMITLHSCHGAAVSPETVPHPESTDSTASCMAMRYPHLAVAMQGCVAPPDDPTDTERRRRFMEEVNGMKQWIDDVMGSLEAAGISMPRTYVNWTSDEDGDVVQLYGEESSKRLRQLKERYDGTNLFAAAYPRLS